MAGEQIDIDPSTIFDNIGERQVEFVGVVDGDDYQFAVQYSVIEAISGESPNAAAERRFNQFIDVIKGAALSALARDTDPAVIVVTEADLDQ